MKENDILEVNEDFRDEFVDLGKADGFSGPMSQMDIMTFANSLAVIDTTFGDDVKALKEHQEGLIGLAYQLYQAYSKREDYDIDQRTPFTKADMKTVNKEVKKLTDFIDKHIKEDKNPPSSYMHRTKVAYRKHMEMMLNGDFKKIKEFSGSDADLYQASLNEFPQPRFMDDPNGDYKNDVARYEAYMKQHPFLEQFEEKYRYYEENLLPHIKDKERGLLNKDKEKEFKKATYDHLLKMQGYFSELKKINNDPETGKVGPFAKSNTQDQWINGRTGGHAEKTINRELDVLRHGWAPDDFKMIHQLDTLMEHLESGHKKKTLTDQEYEKASILYQTFNNTYITNKEERKQALDSLKPVYDLLPKVKNPAAGFEPAECKALYNTQKKADVSVVLLDRGDRLRSDMIKNLERFYKGLSTGHRVGTHTDKGEMRDLKDKTLEVIDMLKSDRRDIYTTQEFQEAFRQLKVKSDNYTKAKRAKFEREVNESIDENLQQSNPAEYRRLKKAAAKKIEDWRPSTRMGETRYNTALEMNKLCAQYEQSLKEEKNPAQLESERNIREAGHNIIHMDDISFNGTKPYDKCVSLMMNFYGKNPAYIPELSTGTTKAVKTEKFLEKCPPVVCDGISDNDFAVVAFNAAYNVDIFNEQQILDHWPLKSNENSYKDMLRRNRTMYTNDIGLFGPRDNSINHHAEILINPARNKAKEAFEAYKKGDKEPLAKILANGIKELTYDTIRVDKIESKDGDFAKSTEMLSKSMEFARKDPELFRKVENQIGEANMEHVKDMLRLKGMLDKSIESERKLELAAENKKPLTKKEKQECIDNIAMYDWVSAIHEKLRRTQYDMSQKCKNVDKELEEQLPLVFTGQRKDITENDLQAKDFKVKASVATSIPNITTSIRTPKGFNALKDLSRQLTKDISAGMSEAEILKATRKLNQSRHDAINKKYSEAAEKKREQSRREMEQSRNNNAAKSKGGR